MSIALFINPPVRKPRRPAVASASMVRKPTNAGSAAAAVHDDNLYRESYHHPFALRADPVNPHPSLAQPPPYEEPQAPAATHTTNPRLERGIQRARPIEQMGIEEPTYQRSKGWKHFFYRFRALQRRDLEAGGGRSQASQQQQQGRSRTKSFLVFLVKALFYLALLACIIGFIYEFSQMIMLASR